MSQTGYERPGRPGQDVPAPDVPAQGALTAGSPDAPAARPAPEVPAAGAGTADPDRLPGATGSVPWPTDPGERLTEGVVELRKRGGPAARPPDGEAAHPLEAVARQAAERVAAEGRPRG
ncbi:hypothetical protein ACFVGY_02595 [Streptomyces sp. NPDC127106]|uniref:hypothetical protein n=1 Tax=Streptomyces sp. NPDC127106 TaxID=3345360 RepID=UPI00363184F7